MPSLKYSVGSKNTNFNSIPAGVDGVCFGSRQQERITALHSSWINRLQLRILPNSAAFSEGGARIYTGGGGGVIHAGDVPPNNRTVSTEESMIPFSSSHNPMPSFIAPRSLACAPVKPQISRGDGDGLLVSGFGPFQVRETRKSTGRGFQKGAFSGHNCLPLVPRGEAESEHRVVRALETKIRDEVIGARLSPFSHRFRPRLVRIGPGAPEKGTADHDPASSSRLQTCFGPWKVERRLKTLCQVTVSPSGGGYEGKSPSFGPVLEISSSPHPARSRGASYYDLSHGSSISRSCLNSDNLNQQPKMQAGKKESEEPFSFWNMGRFKRTNFVSSSSPSPSLDLSRNSSRERAPNADDFITSPKRRRTGRKND